MLAQPVFLFDLGAVLVDIHVPNLYKALESLLDAYHVTDTPTNWIEKLHEKNWWHDHEVGKLSDAEFFELLRLQIHPQCTEAEIVQAWNTIIVGIPTYKFAQLKVLMQHKRVLLLSNTNYCHIAYIQKLMRDTQLEPLESYFHRLYFSYELGLRKPNPDIFLYVLRSEQVHPKSVVFIDDSPENCLSASSLGIHSICHTPSGPLDDYL